MTLHWFDEGDGYQHAHLAPDCSREELEVVDVLITDERTAITIARLPVMPATDAKRLAESLYDMAALFVKLRAEAKAHD